MSKHISGDETSSQRSTDTTAGSYCGMLTYLGQKRQNCDACMATYDRHIHLRGINFQNLAHKCIGSRHIQLGHSKQLSRVEYASPVRTAVLWHVMFYPQ